MVLATASVDESVPEFMKGRGKGWVAAEYQILYRVNPLAVLVQSYRAIFFEGVQPAWDALLFTALASIAIAATSDTAASTSGGRVSSSCWMPKVTRSEREDTGRSFERMPFSLGKLRRRCFVGVAGFEPATCTV